MVNDYKNCALICTDILMSAFTAVMRPIGLIIMVNFRQECNTKLNSSASAIWLFNHQESFHSTLHVPCLVS